MDLYIVKVAKAAAKIAGARDVLKAEQNKELRVIECHYPPHRLEYNMRIMSSAESCLFCIPRPDQIN